jgi:hypothetical protein
MGLEYALAMKQKGCHEYPLQKAEYFRGDPTALSLDCKIIPRILFSANKIVRATIELCFWFI